MRGVPALAVVLLLAGCMQPAEVDLGTATPSADVASPTNTTLDVVPMAQALARWPSDGAMEVVNDTMLVHNPYHTAEAHVVPYTVFRPLVADGAHKVPVLLHSHGFGGKRWSVPNDTIKAYVAAGFAVVSYDQRGHGDARPPADAPVDAGNESDAVRFMHPEYELVDLSQLIDRVATWDWVLLDAPGDPRLGGIGLSYGGAFQVMGAIVDGRFDSLVPEITWNDIVESLAPSGAVKSAWVDGFYGQGNLPKAPPAPASPGGVAGLPEQSDTRPTVTFSQDFHKGFAWTMATNSLPQGQLPDVPDLVRDLKAASPASYPWRLTTPTFLIQGMPDTLFNLNQAVANVEMLRATGTEWALHTHLGGHIFNQNGDLPDTPSPANGAPAIGLQGQAGPRPCGDQTNLTIAWHERHLLKMDVPFGPKVCIALEDGRVATGDDYPLPGVEMRTLDLTCTLDTPCVLPQGGGGGAFVQVDLPDLEEGDVVAGIPHLRAKVTSPGADAIVYLSLQVPHVPAMPTDLLERVVDDQVAVVRLAGPNAAPIDVELDMGGVGTVVGPEGLQLVLSDVAPIYLANGERVPGGIVFDDLQLEVPIVPAALVHDAIVGPAAPT